jgi:hypothetical protein
MPGAILFSSVTTSAQNNAGVSDLRIHSIQHNKTETNYLTNNGVIIFCCVGLYCFGISFVELGIYPICDSAAAP